MIVPTSRFLSSRFIRSRFIEPKFALAGGPPPATITNTDNNVSGVNASSYNYASQALGSGTAADHIIIAAVGLNNASFSLNSVTVDGQAATIVAGANSALVTNHVLAAIAIAPATVNPTGTVNLTFSAAIGRSGIGVFRVANLLSTTPTDTGGDTGASPSDTLNISAGGIAVGVVTHNDTNTVWTGLNERYETGIESGTFQSGAADAFGAAQVGLAISTDSVNEVIMALASFR